MIYRSTGVDAQYLRDTYQSFFHSIAYLVTIHESMSMPPSMLFNREMAIFPVIEVYDLKEERKSEGPNEVDE